MTTAYWCVLLAGFLPICFAALSKILGKRYNNRNPRQWQQNLEGSAQRAHAAQLNTFEAFPFFAAAVVIAHLAHANQARIDALAVAFIVLRVIYGVCYIADKPALRSLVWAGGFGCCVAMFFMGT